MKNILLLLLVAIPSICFAQVEHGALAGANLVFPLQDSRKTYSTLEENKQNYKLATPEGKSYSDLLAEGPVSGLDTVGYLAWTLGQQSEYHSQSQTTSTAVIATQTTNSYKDYKDGIMVSSDFTYGFTAAGTQACFVPQGNEEGKGAGVYMRHETDSPNSSTTGTSAQWGEEILYYDRDAYLTTYGEYSTEMTVYLLNEETITGWEPATDNGDGTFTQVVELDAPKATYYYRYAMMTRGGLDRLPEFDEITLTITFDDDYRVLEIFADEHSQLTYIFSLSSVSKTTTTYSYGEETFDIEPIDLSGGLPNPRSVRVTATRPDGSSIGFACVVRVDTPMEGAYLARGGILPYVLETL